MAKRKTKSGKIFELSIILIKCLAFLDTCISQGAIQDYKKAEDKNDDNSKIEDSLRNIRVLKTCAVSDGWSFL